MVYHIIVSFGRERQYEYKFSHTELGCRLSRRSTPLV
jgi:hypothetical protein